MIFLLFPMGRSVVSALTPAVPASTSCGWGCKAFAKVEDGQQLNGQESRLRCSG